jgi:hypothetical protein
MNLDGWSTVNLQELVCTYVLLVVNLVDVIRYSVVVWSSYIVRGV